MPIVNTLVVIFLIPFSIAVFFFVLTRGALLLRRFTPAKASRTAHIYPLYSNMFLIKLIDFQPLISAILLFQYDLLVSKIVAGLAATDLKDKSVMVTSCPFGTIVPSVVNASFQAGARQVLLVDLVQNELLNVKSKLGTPAGHVEYIEDDATAMQQKDGVADANVMFFLLHELPHDMKIAALSEAGRMLAPGGKLYLAEFHRPDPLLLRLFSRAYFTVFEPLGLALWDSHDPVACLEQMGGWSCERSTVFFGYFQVVTATRL